MHNAIERYNLQQLLPEDEPGIAWRIAHIEQSTAQAKGIHRAHIRQNELGSELCVHYDPQELDRQVLQELIQSARASGSRRYPSLSIPIDGMDCSDCALVIQHRFSRLEGVKFAEVQYGQKNLHLIYDSREIRPAQLRRHVHHLGYRVPEHGLRGWLQANRELLRNVIAGILLVFGWLSHQLSGLPEDLSLILFLLTFLITGIPLARHALRALLRERRFDADFLMVVAAIGAAALGEWAEGGLLLVLFSTGHTLEHRAMDRARSAIHALAALTPKTARVIRDSGPVEVAIEHLQLGEIVAVAPGERIPVDGEIKAGRSTVDQSTLTGESTPIDISPGDHALAGSVNGQGALRVQVERLAADSTLARVIASVQTAQSLSSPSEQLSQRIAKILVPTVLALDLLLMLVPPLFGVPFRESFLRAMTLLVVASPCALALGPPAAVLSGLANAARQGVLIKSGADLESLGALQALAFDKTGTLTIGKPQVVDVLARGEWVAEQILSLAAAVEQHSGHPLAQAILQKAQTQGLQLPDVQAMRSETGIGVEAQSAFGLLKVTRTRDEDLGQSASAEHLQQIRRWQADGSTIVTLHVDEEIAGWIALADTARPEAAPTLQALRDLDIQRFIMLTGDSPQAAAWIAQQVGIEDLRAGLLPQEKVTALQQIMQQSKYVGMVGDGVNDAPALAAATVGIAMGGAKTQVALETADVVLMSDDLARLPFIIDLGRRTRRILQQNLWIALIVIVSMSILALTGLAGISTAVVLHEGSTILVVLNGLRLLRYNSHNA